MGPTSQDLDAAFGVPFMSTPIRRIGLETARTFGLLPPSLLAIANEVIE
jgi:hypothetical protein